MLFGDFLASQATRTNDLTWAGATVPAHPALSGLRVADGARTSVRTVQVCVDDGPGALTWMDDLAEGERAVLLLDALPVEPAVRRLAAALAGRGCELLHAVYIDDAAGIGVVAGLSVQRTPPHLDRADLAETNLRAVTADGAEPDWARARAAFTTVATGYEEALAAAREATAELRAAADRGDARVGPGPDLQEVGGLGGRLRRAWRTWGTSRPLPSPTVAGAAAMVVSSSAAGPATGVRAVTAPRRRPRVAAVAPARPTRRLEFRAPMPIPPGGTRSRPLPLHVDVPGGFRAARTLKRAGVGGYESTTTAWFLALCDTAGPGAVWDVGAGIGTFALLARAYTEREVVGFEPAPEVAAWADHLADLNGLGYALERLAAGESAGTATFGGTVRPFEVLVEPLDRYSRRTGSTPAIIRIAGLAGVREVLRGAMRTVTEHRPWIIGAEPCGELTGLGYRCLPLRGSEPLTSTAPAAGSVVLAPGELADDAAAAARAWGTALELTPPPAR
ncbi:hypothetical protein [Jiangella gansuensis]|uniref:hypothetical protein n=1 Tax=Jiangella gansuensis TaxID=281473 RepID=UPI0004794562|nr:hypothetical protein [Jiangella gansuensis]